MASTVFNRDPIDYARMMSNGYLRRAEQCMPDESPLVRQWILLRTLSSRRYGATVKELAEEMAVSEKTIRRYLQTFQEAGFPLAEDEGEFGRKTWRTTASKNDPPLSFTFDEAVALHLGRRLMEPLAGTLFWDAAQRAFKKIRASLGDRALNYVEQFSGMFHQTMVGASDYSKKADLIDDLMRGIEDRQAVFLTYQSLRATEPVTYDIYPYGLTYHRGSLYLVGRAPEHDEIRHWKVDRIEDAKLTGFPFHWPEDFDLQAHLATSFGVYHGNGDVHVKIRFSPTVARYVTESKWHASQRLIQHRDGSVIAEFDLDNTEEIMRWVLSFGKHAEVLEPGELCNAIVEELDSLRSVYGQADALPTEAGGSPANLESTK